MAPGLELRCVTTPRLCGALDTLDSWLRPDVPWSLRDEYPQVFGPGSRAVHHLLLSGEELVAHAATLDIEIRVRGRRWQPRLVGSVVVDPQRRGHGHGLEIMEDVVREFERGHKDALVLWSDKPEFYAKLGLVPFGQEFHIAVLPGPGAERIEGGRVRAATEDDLEALLLLHLAKPVRSQRSPRDFAAFVRIPRCSVAVLEREGDVVAYAALGKGLDFEGYVHEFGGSDDDVASLLRELATVNGRPLGLLVPLWRAPLLRAFDDGTQQQSPLALGLVLDAPVDAAFDGFDSI